MEARHKAPSGARENRPFAGQESPISRHTLPLRATQTLKPGAWNRFPQLETLNFELETPRSAASVPHPVPPLPGLSGLFRDKKIKKKDFAVIPDTNAGGASVLASPLPVRKHFDVQSSMLDVRCFLCFLQPIRVSSVFHLWQHSGPCLRRDLQPGCDSKPQIFTKSPLNNPR